MDSFLRLCVITTVLSCAVTTIMAEDDWTKQCSTCRCIWANGKKTAACNNSDLHFIPKDLSSEIREIDFSNNPLFNLPQNQFSDSNLRDIHKIKMQNCSLDGFHDEAFRSLKLIIELDMSRNYLQKLTKSIFKDNVKLRVVTFSYNKIKTVDPELFHNMTYLQRILLDNNEIETLADTSFYNLPALQHIGLDNNRLKTLGLDLRTSPKMNSITLHGNPWICDCHLEPFRNFTVKGNVVTGPTMCEGPERYKGVMWTSPETFACMPRIIVPDLSTVMEVSGQVVSLSCKVYGNPTPDVDWMTNGKILANDPKSKKQKYIIQKTTYGDETFNNLTISNFNYKDRGDYKCIAKNPGGTDERNITILYTGTTMGTSTPMGINLGLIIGLGVVIVVTLLIILVLLVCFCKRNNTASNRDQKNEDSDGRDEYIGMHNQPELKKGLLTDVNPVSKPPRVTATNSVISGGTEVSDAKRPLVDDSSIFDLEDDNRSMDYTLSLHRKPFIAESPYGSIFPPDLLPYPPRGSQPSPAGSSASTVADTSRLPPSHGPQSPLHSPIYDQIYKTLPRSHSPYGLPAVQPRVPRLGHGYVTIPRRPRQSWSSEAPMSDIGEPLYDNLGLRTNINGSSALSLNKVNDQSTPKSNRMFPPSTIDPIAEHDTMPTTVRTLPRNLNSTKLSPSRTNWAKANAEALRSPERRDSTHSLPEGKKIPPRPPPKPKKRISTGPLFEDEGEDGTEV